MKESQSLDRVLSITEQKGRLTVMKKANVRKASVAGPDCCAITLAADPCDPADTGLLKITWHLGKPQQKNYNIDPLKAGARPYHLQQMSKCHLRNSSWCATGPRQWKTSDCRISSSHMGRAHIMHWTLPDPSHHSIRQPSESGSIMTTRSIKNILVDDPDHHIICQYCSGNYFSAHPKL